jgi:replication factor A1
MSMDSKKNFKGRKFFDDIAAEGLGRGAEADYIDVRCVPVYLKTDSQWYDACPNCNKKVQRVGANQDTFRCEKCDKVVNPQQRYLVSIQASDNVSQQWLTLFNEAAEEFIGMPASELKKRCDADPSFITKIAQLRMHRPLLMRIRVKEERQGADQESQVKCSVVRLTEILPRDGLEACGNQLQEECNQIIDAIEGYYL